MFNPSTNKKFKSPIGRIATVDCIQNYHSEKHPKVLDTIKQNPKRNFRYKNKTEYDTLGFGSDFPQVHKQVKSLLGGKPKRVFNDDKIFDKENDNKKKVNKKSNEKKDRKPRLDYMTEFSNK
jgi:hypothetical protein